MSKYDTGPDFECQKNEKRKEKNKKRIQKVKIVNEYDQEIPQSQTADNPAAPGEKVKNE